VKPRNRLILSLLALAVVFLVATAGYRVIEAKQEITWFQAAYMTVITLTTVGYGEVWAMSDAARMWTLGVIVFGIGTVSVAFTSLITMFVSGELQVLHTRRKMEHAIEQMRNHVIVCGYGRTGTLIVQELKKRRVPTVILEVNLEHEAQVQQAGVPYLIEDATDDATLLRAGIMHARALVVVLGEDADNVYITLTAHALRMELLIIARATQASTEAKLKRAGASRVVCPQVVEATRISNIITHPNVVDFMEMTAKGVQLEMDEYVVKRTSRICGKPLRESLVREKSGAIVVAVKRSDGNTMYSPGPEFVIDVGDTLIVVGPAGVSEQLATIGNE